jgi:VanZ family protein
LRHPLLLVAFRIAAWSLLVAIAFVTPAPVEVRPQSGASANLERFVALLALGLAFALAYPRRIAEAALLVVAAAVSFELLQALDPSRHARLGDVAVKVVGGLTGILLGTLVLWRRNALDAQVPFLSWLFRRR